MTGAGDAPETDGLALTARGDCVVVTLNHRLNLFGYLHLEPLFGADYAGAANAGLLDIIAALRWIRASIGAFGGDPSRVTLFGQSGGGAKIATLMAMPDARGLFHRAWTMSGQQVTAQGPRAALARTQAVLKSLGVAAGDSAGLQALSTQAVLNALALPDTSGAGALYCGPVLDGVTLPRHPFWPDAPSQSATIPMVPGNTRQETSILIARSDPGVWSLTWETLPAKLAPAMVSDLDVREVIATYRALYPDLDAPQVFIAATTAGRSWRGQIIEAEARAVQGAPTWVYQLDWKSPRDGGKWGAFHTLDIPLVFSNTSVPDSASGDGEEARRVAARMSEALITFAKTGAPGADWPRYDLGRRATRIFDTASRIENDPRGAERRLFARVPYIQPGTF